MARTLVQRRIPYVTGKIASGMPLEERCGIQGLAACHAGHQSEGRRPQCLELMDISERSRTVEDSGHRCSGQGRDQPPLNLEIRRKRGAYRSSVRSRRCRVIAVVNQKAGVDSESEAPIRKLPSTS